MNPAPRPWVLLRGLAREAGHWDVFLQIFGRAMHPRPVIAIDLPGNGTLWKERSPLQVAAMLSSVRRQLAARGMQPPYDLLAMSMGAMVGVAWAQAHPQELAHAVLINTSLRPFSAFHERLQPAAWPALARALWPGSVAARQEAAVLSLTSNRLGTRAADTCMWRWETLRAEYPATRGNVIRQLLAAARFRALPQAPAVPLLLLASQRDRLVSPRCSEVIAREWQCAIALHPAAGHDLPLDDPAWVVRAVQRWLREPG